MDFKTVFWIVTCPVCGFYHPFHKTWLCSCWGGDEMFTWKHIQCETCDACKNCHDMFKEVRDESIRLHKKYADEVGEAKECSEYPSRSLYYSGDWNVEEWFNEPKFLEHLDNDVEPVPFQDAKMRFSDGQVL